MTAAENRRRLMLMRAQKTPKFGTNAMNDQAKAALLEKNRENKLRRVVRP